MKLADIQAMDYNEIMSLSESELHKVVNTTRSVARKRMARLQKSDYGSTVASYNYEQEGGAKTTRGMTINQLRHELRRDLDFLDDRTSTVKGADEVRREFEARMTKLMGGQRYTISRRNYGRFWSIFEKLKEHPTTAVYARLAHYEEVQTALAEVMTDMLQDEKLHGEDDDKIIDMAVERFNQTYEAEQRARNKARADMEKGGGTDVTGATANRRGNGNR